MKATRPNEKSNQMSIKKMISQSRRDFTAIIEGEFCGNTTNNNRGYDDNFYHENVIPNMKCKSCEQSTISKGGEIKAQATKYPDGFVI